MKEQLPYHPKYGLPDAFRFKVLADAANTSIREAARVHNVGESTIYKWKKHLRVAQEKHR